MSLQSVPPPHVRRWLGPWTATQGGHIELQNLLSTPDCMNNTVTNTAYATIFSYAGIATMTSVPDGNMGGLGIGWSDGVNAGNKNFNIGNGGWFADSMVVNCTPVANKDYGMLYTFNRSTLQNTFRVCEFVSM